MIQLTVCCEERRADSFNRRWYVAEKSLYESVRGDKGVDFNLMLFFRTGRLWISDGIQPDMPQSCCRR